MSDATRWSCSAPWSGSPYAAGSCGPKPSGVVRTAARKCQLWKEAMCGSSFKLIA